MRKLLLALCAISAFGVFEAATSPAEAVVYCRYINYPANCVVRPGVVLVPRPAARVVYCQYINYPANCVARPGVVLAPRPVARAVARPVARAVTPGLGAPGVGIRRGTPANRGGPVNRIGRR